MAAFPPKFSDAFWPLKGALLLWCATWVNEIDFKQGTFSEFRCCGFILIF